MNFNFDQFDLESFLDKEFNDFQAWAIENPDEALSKALLPIISFSEGLIANMPTYLDSKRRLLGPNFCCAGQVVLGEFAELEKALTSPQARTWRLGTTVLDSSHCPNLDVGGRNVFLLALSDEPAGGNGDHEAFRQCLEDYVLNQASSEREQDEIVRQLLNQLAIDYRRLSAKEFFNDSQQGWKGFIIRYIHYVLLGIDPNDEAKIALLIDVHYNHASALYYFAVLGQAVATLDNLPSSLQQMMQWLEKPPEIEQIANAHRHAPKLIEEAARLYANAPALANFEEREKYRNMTRQELAKLLVSIIAIAGIQGPLSLGKTAMGYLPLPSYEGQNTGSIRVQQYWDKLDLDDRDAVLRYVLECARLWAPVSASHHVATEPLTVKIADKERTFPAGTKILIPMSLGLLDEHFWGPTTYEFDAGRENLCSYHMGFNSVGDRSAGRICPGKALALTMLSDVIIALGKVRRSSSP